MASSSLPSLLPSQTTLLSRLQCFYLYFYFDFQFGFWFRFGFELEFEFEFEFELDSESESFYSKIRFTPTKWAFPRPKTLKVAAKQQTTGWILLNHLVDYRSSS